MDGRVMRMGVVACALVGLSACGADAVVPPSDGGGDLGALLDGGGLDAARGDGGDVDLGSADAGELDAESVDASEFDAASVDGGEVDASGADAGDVDAGDVDAGGADAGGVDAGAVDAGRDAGAVDAGRDAGAVDAGLVDAGPSCGPFESGSCAPAGTSCLSCPAGGPVDHFLCTTTCTADASCTDPTRPHCNRDLFASGSSGICTSVDFSCIWGAVCASPDTMVATPSGERSIAELRVGDLVLSLDHGVLRVVPILATRRMPVSGHHVVRITLESGRVVEMSEGHPTAEGVQFRMLAPGMRLGDATIAALELVPYAYDATYDILPASDTGTYVAAGALVGTTMRGD